MSLAIWRGKKAFMTSDFPLVVPPAQNRDAEITHNKAGRHNVEFFQRKAVAKLIGKLSNFLKDAAVHVGQGPEILGNPGRYQLMVINHSPCGRSACICSTPPMIWHVGGVGSGYG